MTADIGSFLEPFLWLVGFILLGVVGSVMGNIISGLLTSDAHNYAEEMADTREKLGMPNNIEDELPRSVEEEEEEVADPEVVEEIKNASSAEELMEIVRGYDFVGEENDVLLEKALAFADELNTDDWELIQESAAPESGLEKEASRRLDLYDL